MFLRLCHRRLIVNCANINKHACTEFISQVTTKYNKLDWLKIQSMYCCFGQEDYKVNSKKTDRSLIHMSRMILQELSNGLIPGCMLHAIHTDLIPQIVNAQYL